MTAKTVTVTLLRGNGACAIPVPFDSKAVFGKVRAPVKVTLNGYTFRSTIASMGGQLFIPLRKSNREAAGLEGDERVAVTIELDTAKRDVEAPPDLKKALSAAGVLETWRASSFTQRREDTEAVVGARKPETRARRIANIVRAADERAAKVPRGTR
jgi:Domain of unknown function (DUF1905)/Bacteriocin-protection, YdeI or OmpD-Associated